MQNREENWHLLSIQETFHLLETTPSGLSEIEAKKRLLFAGLNQITRTKDPDLWILFLRQFLTPFVFILSVAVAIKIFTSSMLDAYVLIVTILLMACIGFFQEMKAERALRALKKLAAHKSKVLRDGVLHIIPSEMLVPGDVIHLEIGDTVPADARLFETVQLKMKESMLTGESLPSEKDEKTLDEDVVISDRANMVYTGTVVVFGKASAVITNTGMFTCLGQIATSIQEIKPEPTPLQKNIRSLGNWMLVAIFGAVFCFAFIALYSGMSLTDVLVLSVAAIISAIPEGLPVAFTVTFAAGMHAMAKRNAIMRRLTVVETLGATTVICSDKTGTLTLNQMTVSQVYVSSSHTKKELLEIGVLCNDADMKRGSLEVIGDPTEGALLVAAHRDGICREALLEKFPRTGEIPFLSENLYMATLHHSRLICIKGAPEKLLMLSCITEEEKKKVSYAIEQMTGKALRLIAVGKLELESDIEELTEDHFRGKIQFIGFFGMTDPPREEVISAIQSCREAGIRTIMITGDNPKTAEAIGKQLNIVSQGVIIGSELAKMSREELCEKMKTVSIFARVEPSHKLRLVQSLQSEGHVVAMTGDGVNDAPALEAADIGISMGLSGTDVAKEASDMVLADDRFDSIVLAIEEGRAIYHRLRNVCTFLITTCFGELFGLILCVLFLKTAPLLALQILWINLVSGSVIAIPLGFEPKDGGEMKQLPRDSNARLISPEMVYRIMFLASLLGLSSFFMFFYCYSYMSLEKARTMVLCSIIVFEWLISLEMRSSKFPLWKMGFFKNIPLLSAIAITCSLHLTMLYVPLFQKLFNVVSLSWEEWGIAIIPGVAIFILEGLRKAYYSRSIPL